jgi:hypothetical protein
MKKMTLVVAFALVTVLGAAPAKSKKSENSMSAVSPKLQITNRLSFKGCFAIPVFSGIRSTLDN